MAGEYYAWSVDKKPVEVRLNLSAVERLQALVLEAFQRGLGEIHGILLGRIERRKSIRRVYIEDFELFDPAAGPPKPRRGSWLDPVGLYRSHVREELRLDRLDAALIENFFTNPGMVYLLVRPRKEGASTAAFFIQENGAMQGHRSYREFPLHAGDLRSGRYPLASESTMAPAARRWRWAGAVAGIVVALLAGWWFWSRTGADQATSTHTAVQESPAPRPTPPPAERTPEPAPRSTAISPPNAQHDAEADRVKPAKRKHERRDLAPDSAELHDPAERPSRPFTVATRRLRRAVSHIPGFGFLSHDRERRRDQPAQ